jgi:phage-related protein
MPEQAYHMFRFKQMMSPTHTEPKPVRWVGSSKDDLSTFPQEVRRRVGGALWDAQCGLRVLYAKPLRGFVGSGVLEIVDDHDGDTYRAVYTVRFAGVVYVLHAFQKKSKRGIATPKAELDLIKQQLKRVHERTTNNGQETQTRNHCDRKQRQCVCRPWLR